MPNHLLNWSVVTPSSLLDLFRIIKYNDGLAPWVAGPSLSPTTNNYLWTGLLKNVIYKFRIKNNCPLGSPTFSNVYEWLEFGCNSLIENIMTQTTANLHMVRDGNSGLEGAPISGTTSTDIINVEYKLYKSGVLVSGPTLGTLGAGYETSINYTSLLPNTNYEIRYVLQANVNGTPIRSDDANQLATYCSYNFTTGANTQVNQNILISNGAGVLSSGSYPPVNIINFEGDSGSGYAIPAAFNVLLLDYFCADGVNPISSGGIGPALYGPLPCASPNANNNFTGTLLGDSGGFGYSLRITLDNSPGGGSGGPFGNSLYKLRVVDALNNIQIQYIIPGTTIYIFNGVQDYELTTSPKTCGIEVYIELI